MTKSFEVVHLDPQQVRFERRGDTLSMRLADGTCFPRVALRCCFPVSNEHGYLSVRDASTVLDPTADEQPEIGIIEDWTALGESEREAVQAELGVHYFVPKIRKVGRVKEELGFLYWTVATDRGPKEFVMRDSIVTYTREVSPGHWLLIDVNQARYEIPDINALDPDSQRLVKRVLLL